MAHLTKRNINPATGGKDIVLGTPFNCCIAVNCGTAGTNTVTWADGSTSLFTFIVGSANPCQITNVAADGAADDLVALYND